MKFTVHILKERCKGCGICIEVCQTRVLELSDEVNDLEYAVPRVAHPSECINCRMCEMFCPDFAIWVTVNEDEASA